MGDVARRSFMAENGQVSVPLRTSAVRDQAGGPGRDPHRSESSQQQSAHAAPPAGEARTQWSRYRTYLPDPSVRAFGLLGWWGHAAWDRCIRILPDGCADLIAREGRLVVVLPAPGARRIRLHGADRPIGLRIRCGTAGALLGHDLTKLAALAGPTGEIDVAELSEELARTARAVLAAGGPPHFGAPAGLVLARLRAGRRPDPAVLHAVRLLRASGGRVDRVAYELGLTPRTLHRRVSAEVGFGPKRLHRVFRFQRFLTAVPTLARSEAGLARLAAELGYADQAHLGRDCLRLAGASPGRLVASWARRGAGGSGSCPTPG
jgi:AraC-like DNA-binding protein